MRQSLLLFIVYASLAGRLWAGQVETLAGTGQDGATGDGGPAVRARVGGPFGVAIGPDEALYVCETTTHRIRRIDRSNGRISTVAGSGLKGYSGDGGPGAEARLNEPYEIRFDDSGNMYFVEMQNHVVRRVDRKSGIITTVAGTGEQGFSGDGGPASRAKLSRPHSIALDHQQNLYICDIGNHRIRRVDLGSGIITTYAGTGERKPTPDGADVSGTPLNGPRALDFHPRHGMYLALREGNAVYRINLDRNTLHHVAGTGRKGYGGDGGPAKNADLSGPKGIAINESGDIFLADTESHTIRVIRAATNRIETVVGNGRRGDGPDGSALECRLDRPHGICVDRKGSVYIGDSNNHRVRKLSATAVSVRTVRTHVQWKRIELDSAFRSEGVAAADINRDGRMDVFAGDLWYEAPDWKRHEVREPGKFVAGVGYSNSFCNYSADLNRDGWPDLILVGFPGAPFHWYENPGRAGGRWQEHLIWKSICNESPEFEDLDGDGVPEIIFGSQPERQMGFVRIPGRKRISQPWPFQPISDAGDPMLNGTFKYYHGLGIGDVNSDGRQDVMIPNGWWEAPQDRSRGPWRFHPWFLSETGMAPALKAANMYAYDLDLDGDQDIIMSSAHAYGIWWFENIGGNDRPEFKYHLVDRTFSQTHALEMVDINGDGTLDAVTGKRFFAHNGSDPGGRDEVVMYWYEIRRRKGQQPGFIPHEIEAGRGTGIGTQFQVTDMNADGWPDIVLSNKKGVNLLIQEDGSPRR